jgi:O-antigen ligase
MSFPLALALAVWLTGGVLRGRVGAATVWRWLGAGLAAALLAGGILASFSRGAWLGATAGLAAMIAVAGRRSLAIGASVGLLALAFLWLGGGAFLPADITERVGSIGDSLGYRDVRRMVITPENYAVAERLGMWQAGLNMFDDRPITGVGAGNYDAAYPHYRVPQFIYSRGHAHNYYIHVAAETGVVGLLAYGLLLIGAWIDAGRGLLRVRAGWPRAVTIGAVGVLVAVMTHNIGENLHVLNMNIHLFAVLAIPALALRLTQQEATRP